MSIKVFLSENLPEKKDNILSVISFDGKVDYKDNVLSSGPQILNRKNIYEIWEVQDKVSKKNIMILIYQEVKIIYLAL